MSFFGFCKKTIYWLSGEYLLKDKANSGTIIVLRALIITALLYGSALILKIYVDKCPFSSKSLAKNVVETIPWLGAILAASHVGLYARFSSQYMYICNLYNNIMLSKISMDINSRFAVESHNKLCAAFIEDAIHMHLSKKKGINTAIYGMLQDSNITKYLLNSEHFTETKYIRKLFSDIEMSIKPLNTYVDVSKYHKQ